MKWGEKDTLTRPPGTLVLRYEPGSYEETKVKELPLDYPVMSSPVSLVFHAVWGLGKYLDIDKEQMFYTFKNDEKHTGGKMKKDFLIY